MFRLHPYIQKYFNPRTSYEVRCKTSKISIRAPRMRCDMPPRSGSGTRPILIRAPRMRCDSQPDRLLIGFDTISIRAPRMRCDFNRYISSIVREHFNPRTSYEVRSSHMHRDNAYFNPRPSYEVRSTDIMPQATTRS